MTRREEKMPRPVAGLHAQFAVSAELEHAVKAIWSGVGHGG